MSGGEFYLRLAEEISEASKCLRGNWGVVIVKNDMVLGLGYNGPPRGVVHCDPCRRAENKPGEGYDKCVAAHAEVNAIIQAGGRERCLGSTMYIGSHNRHPKDGLRYNTAMGMFPCDNCFRYIINAGIEVIVQRGEDGETYPIMVSDAIAKLNKRLEQ